MYLTKFIILSLHVVVIGIWCRAPFSPRAVWTPGLRIFLRLNRNSLWSPVGTSKKQSTSIYKFRLACTSAKRESLPCDHAFRPHTYPKRCIPISRIGDMSQSTPCPSNSQYPKCQNFGSDQQSPTTLQPTIVTMSRFHVSKLLDFCYEAPRILQSVKLQNFGVLNLMILILPRSDGSNLVRVSRIGISWFCISMISKDLSLSFSPSPKLRNYL